MRVTSKGQVTIPLEVRQKLGIRPSTEVEFVLEDGAARLRVAAPRAGGSELVEAMRGCASIERTTDEILSLTRSDE